MDAIEALHTAGTMRWLKPDAVPPELVAEVIRTATCAASPANVQPWHFVVVTDPATRHDLLGLMAPALDSVRKFAHGLQPDDPVKRRTAAGAAYLVDHLPDVPVLIFVCGRSIYPAAAPDLQMMYSAVYGAAQNLLVAARATGLGVAYTTFHRGAEEDVKRRLGIPPDVHICVTMPLGWPHRRFGRLSRKPVSEVMHVDRW